MSILYIFAGLPGAGKSTLSRAFAREQKAVYIRVDTIEQTLRDAGSLVIGSEGYDLAYRIAADNLRLGSDTVADSVNPIQATRDAWRNVAINAGMRFIEIEIECSSRSELRRRIETRTTGVPGLELPTWTEVVDREYQPWDIERVVIDTAGRTIEQSNAELRRRLGDKIVCQQ